MLETCARRYGLCFRRHQNQTQNARILAGSMLSSRSNGDDRPVFNGNRVFQQEVTQEGLYRLFLTLYPVIRTQAVTPKKVARLSFENMRKYINSALESFPSIKLLVLTGGECFT